MKTILLIIFTFILSVQISNAQWLTETRLTNAAGDSYTSFNNATPLAANGNNIYAVWTDQRDGNDEIYFKHSSDLGITWGTDTRITNNSFFSGYPSIAVSGSTLHLTWYDNRDGNDEIYYKRSTDGGNTWGTDTRLTTADSSSAYPSMSVVGSVVHIVWRDSRFPVNEIYYRHSTDAGLTWGPETRLTNDPANSYSASVSASGNNVHVAWEDNRDGNGVEIYYKRSTDGGNTWGTDTRLTTSAGNSEYPCVVSSDSIIHVAWNDNRDGNIEIYYKRSTDWGSTWSPDTRLTNSPGNSYRPSISVSGTNLHMVWYDQRDGNYEIYYKNSSNYGVTWGTDTRISNNSFVSAQPFVAASGPSVNVIWDDNRDGNYEIYYIGDPTGNTIGIQQISTNIPARFSLSQNYPNPFNPNSKIKFQIAKLSNTKLVIFDIRGREVSTLVNENLNPGTYEVDFDGSKFSSGVYFYKITAGDFIQTKKMTLVK